MLNRKIKVYIFLVSESNSLAYVTLNCGPEHLLISTYSCLLSAMLSALPPAVFNHSDQEQKEWCQSPGAAASHVNINIIWSQHTFLLTIYLFYWSVNEPLNATEFSDTSLIFKGFTNKFMLQTQLDYWGGCIVTMKMWCLTVSTLFYLAETHHPWQYHVSFLLNTCDIFTITLPVN